MPKTLDLPYRQIHLDFHTGPDIPDVGAEFDPRKFAAVMKAAHVNSVTVFAKCHHGHLYYNTKRPERHPGLKRGLNLLREQVKALHAAGIRAPIYISVQCDEYAANTHPEWVARKPDTGQVKGGNSVFNAAWQVMDMSSPYQDYLAEQTEEVLRKFKPVDGIFFDMCWDQRTASKWAIAGMRKAGLNPESDTDRLKFAKQVTAAYMERFYGMVKRSSPEATVYFNSRPLAELGRDVKYLEQIEIEALPTGGWGYMYFPKNVRWARQFGRPYLGMTGRFHKSWADFGGLKPYAALEYETSQMIAHGARCSIGDQMHPRGVLDGAAYELIGNVYARVAEREEWLKDAKPVVQVGLMQLCDAEGTAAHAGAYGEQAENGAVRMLTQLRQQFDVIGSTAELQGLDLVVLPDYVNVDERLERRLTAFVRGGGAVLASHTSGLSADGTKVLLPEVLPEVLAGGRAEGVWPYTTMYFRPTSGQVADLPETEHVIYERGVKVRAAAGAEVLGHMVEPYFQRTWEHFCSHAQTPPRKLTTCLAAAIRGRVGYISFPVFMNYGSAGNWPYRALVGEMLERLLPEPVLRVDGPTGLETSVTQQGGRTVVHLLYYSPERRAPNLDLVEDIVPVHDLRVSLKVAKAPRSVRTAPEREELRFIYAAGRAGFTLPVLRGHAMIVVE